jgi:hypothetical protein
MQNSSAKEQAQHKVMDMFEFQTKGSMHFVMGLVDL